MATPTVIRHAQRGNIILQVITYQEYQHLNAVFQEYVTYETGRTVLVNSQPYLTEQGAISEWQAQVGFFPAQ